MGIKHLSPKSRSEFEQAILNLPSSLEKIDLLNKNYIEVTKKEANKLFNELSSFEKLKIGIKLNNLKIIKKASKNPQLTEWEMNEIILWAINQNHKEIVKTLFLNEVKFRAKEIKEGRLPNTYLKEIKDQYLKAVISYGDTEIVQILLDADVNIHVDFDLPFVQACHLSNVEIVRQLFKAGANVDAQEGMGLRSACIVGNVEIVKELIKLGADVHVENDEPLRLAAANGHTEIVQILLQNGADASAYNYLALYWATLNGHEKIIKILEDEQERLNKA